MTSSCCPVALALIAAAVGARSTSASAQALPAGGLVPVEVSVAGDAREPLSLHRLVLRPGADLDGVRRGWAFELVCRPPCTAMLPPGATEFGVSVGSLRPRRVDAPAPVEPGRRIVVRYESDAVIRAGGLWMFVLASLAHAGGFFLFFGSDLAVRSPALGVLLWLAWGPGTLATAIVGLALSGNRDDVELAVEASGRGPAPLPH